MARATGPPIPFICGHTESCYLWKETHNIFYDSTLLKGKSFPPTKHERPEVSYPSYPSPKHLSSLQAWTIGSSSNNEGDGYENNTIKVNSRCFKLYRTFSISLNSPNVGIFFWRWIRILKDCKKVSKKEKKVVVLCSRPQQNVKLRNFTSNSCSDGKEMYKKARRTWNVAVLLIFWRFRCRRCHCCSVLADHKCEQ